MAGTAQSSPRPLHARLLRRRSAWGLSRRPKRGDESVAISNVIERLGRAIFEAPFGGRRISKDSPELAEIRLAVIDAVKAKSHRASGKSVFPYNIVRIELLGVPEEQAAAFQSEFLSNYLADELKTGLKRSSCRFPADLRVAIHTTPRLPKQGENWL